MERTEFLVIGAGPYGLAAAAYARALGIEVTVVGWPMEAWEKHMPVGMLLRSGPDWHLDAQGVLTLQRYLQERGLTPEQATPIPLALFREYGLWFMQQSGLAPRTALVRELSRTGRGFLAALDDGSTVHAEQVLLGLGFAAFRHLPAELVRMLPAERWSHSGDAVAFDFLRGRRVLIIGGRQSAYEWAALMHEQGVAEIHLSHRHAVPEFTETDWSWVQSMVEGMVEDHAWWRQLSQAEQAALGQRFWEAGRLKLEPWLAPRIATEQIRIWEKTELTACEIAADGALMVWLNSGVRLEVDHVILATGYRVEMENIPFLDRTTLLNAMRRVDGCPALDPEFRTSVPGLYVTGLAATRDFGPFFGFVVGAPVAARIIGDAVAATAQRGTKPEKEHSNRAVNVRKEVA